MALYIGIYQALLFHTLAWGLFSRVCLNLPTTLPYGDMSSLKSCIISWRHYQLEWNTSCETCPSDMNCVPWSSMNHFSPEVALHYLCCISPRVARLLGLAWAGCLVACPLMQKPFVRKGISHTHRQIMQWNYPKPHLIRPPLQTKMQSKTK